MDNQNQPLERPQDFELVDLLFRDKIAAQRVLPGASSTSTTPQISESFQARFQSFIDQIPSYMHSSNKPGFFTHFFLGSFSTLLDTQLNADKIHIKNLYYRFDNANTLKIIAETEAKTNIFIFTEGTEEARKSEQLRIRQFEFTEEELNSINSAREKLNQSKLNRKIEIKLIKIDSSKIVDVVENKKIVKNAGPPPTKFPFKEIRAQRNPGDYLERDIEELSGKDKDKVNEIFGNILNDVKKTHTALDLSKDVYGSSAREADQHGFLAGVLDNFRYRYNTRIYLEQFAGRGYADIVLLVRGAARSTRSIPIIIELKAGTSAGTEPSNARQQAEGYALGFQPNTVRVLTFSNDVICVGLNLDYVPTDLVKETLKEINQIIDDENHIMGGALKEAIKDKLSEFTETNDPQLV
ncbi:MAG: hypothetical protein AB2990_07000, partial (plasmid) [Candidatus Symbiodolus clandestinus]